MSSTINTVAPSSTACSNLYDTPVKDAVCAMPYSKDNVDHMNACCKDAPVVSYYDGCGLYCLAVGQNVTDLVDCLYGHKAAWADVFCKGNGSATATASDLSSFPATASASVIGTGSASTKTSTSTATTTDTSDDDSKSKDGEKGAAAGIRAGLPGLWVTSLVLGAFLLRVVQI